MKGYRTLLFNVAAAVLTVLIGYNWADALPGGYAWAGAAIVAAGNFALRFVTSTAVGEPQ